MASQTHLKILKRGARGWNKWRRRYPDIVPDLSNANLSGESFPGINFQDMNLTGAILCDVDFQNANFSNVNLTDADLGGSRLDRAILTGVILQGTKLGGTSFANTNLANLDFSSTNLTSSILKDADLRSANLCEISIDDADLTRCNLHSAHLSGASLRNSCLKGACLDHAIASATDFGWADLSHASLQHTILRGASFRGADLRSANLHKSILFGANLYRANLLHTDFSAAILGETILCQTNLHLAEGLDTIEHHAPSEISIHALYQTSTLLPERFLKGIGLLSSDISQLASILDNTPRKRANSFIGYQTSNKEFALQLAAELQQRDLSCWIFPLIDGIVDPFLNVSADPSNLYGTLILLLTEVPESPDYERLLCEALGKEVSEKKRILYLAVSEEVQQKILSDNMFQIYYRPFRMAPMPEEKYCYLISKENPEIPIQLLCDIQDNL